MGFPGEDAADVVAALVADLGLPRCLTDVGIERAQFGAIAAHAMKENWLHSNPRSISDAAQIMEILNAAA
jgi:maleylacetate reductase